MSNINLSLAIGNYDHVRDFTQGLVKAEGLDITFFNLTPEEMFYRFSKFREWDVSEMSFGKYASLVSQDDEGLSAIPVFPSRAFRLSSIYIRLDAGIKQPQDLAGKRVGIPEWAQTASVYTRGYLMHDVGIQLSQIDWYQAGVNEPGRVEKVGLRLPAGVRYTSVPERSLSEMLAQGDLDAVMSARPPAAFLQGHPKIGRLFDNFIKEEQAHWQKTGIFPIMHVVAIRRALLQQHPWIAMNLLKAFEEAKRRSLARALDVTASQFPIPWAFEYAAQSRAMFGEDFWPYGLEPNRPTLAAFLRFAWEQGVCHRHLSVEELFPVEVQSSFRI